MKLAVQQKGLALEYAAEEVRAGIQIVKLAVQQDGMALPLASAAIVVLAARRELEKARAQASLELAARELAAAVQQQRTGLEAALDRAVEAGEPGVISAHGHQEKTLLSKDLR